jgi:ubiquinone/menaquinone biosynthesis C-methylase UbiE
MQLAEIYNRNAAYWDSKLYRAVYYPAYARLFRTIRHTGGLRVLGQVLDCGIGAGLLSEALLDVAGGQIGLNGIDMSPKLLAMSKQKFSRRSVHARLALGDIRRLPYRDEQMDLTIGALVLEHVPQPVDAVCEMARVLRRGGPLVIVATRRGAPDWYFRGKYHYKPYPAAAVLEWMNAAGLAEVQTIPLSGIARFFAQAYTGRKRSPGT